MFTIFLGLPNIYAQYSEDLHERTLYELANQTNVFNKAQIDVGNNPTQSLGNSYTNTFYVLNTDSNTVSVISSETNTKIKDIPVGNFPLDISINPTSNTIYVSNYRSDTVSVISGVNNTKIKDIPVGVAPAILGLNPIENKIYVSNSGSNTTSVISGVNNTKIKDIPVGNFPAGIASNFYTNMIYVLYNSNTISVISGQNDTKIKDIYTGEGSSTNRDLIINYDTNKIYISNLFSDTVSVISGVNNTKIKDIPVESPGNIYLNPTTNTIYVVSLNAPYIVSIINGENDTKIDEIKLEYDVGSDSRITIHPHTFDIYVSHPLAGTISVISHDTNKKIKHIKVGHLPGDISINPDTDTVYVVNSNSNGISVIDGVSGEVVAGLKFNINPQNSGYIECDGLKSPIAQQIYLWSGTKCIAKPNKGFEFLNWEENFGNNSTQIINVSKPASVLESIKDFFYIKSDEPEATINITKFGSFTANFEELPPPLPPEYVATLFGVVVTAFISSWLTPTIIGWRKSKKHQLRLNDYQNEIQDLDKDGIIDKNDISNLGRLRDKVISGYTRGDITKEQYDVLLNNISTRYNEIFQNEINVLKNTNNNAEKIKLLEEIQSDLNDAYLKKKIDKEHYDLLKEMISKLNNNKNEQ